MSSVRSDYQPGTKQDQSTELNLESDENRITCKECAFKHRRRAAFAQPPKAQGRTFEEHRSKPPTRVLEPKPLVVASILGTRRLT
jgi:hypothetical protein